MSIEHDKMLQANNTPQYFMVLNENEKMIYNKHWV